MLDPLRHSWRWWQTLTEASSGEWPAGGKRGCVLCGGEEKSSRVLLRRQKTDSHSVKRWFSFRHLQAPSFYVEMRHVWPLQCKWDLNMELEASSQAQCDCCVCVYDCLPVFSVSFIPRSNWHAMSTRLCHYCLSFSSSFISWAVWAVLISTHRKSLTDGAWAGWTNSGWSNYVLKGRQGHRLTTDDGLQHPTVVALKKQRPLVDTAGHSNPQFHSS